MKYIRLTAWGNKKNHLIPIKAIADFEFDGGYTIVRLSNGNTLNVIEDELIISSMLEELGVKIIDKTDLEEDDELPF
jgi:hypothetical protein